MLSLVRIDHVIKSKSPTALDDLVGFLAQRLRVTDDFGMLDNTRLGVILPETSDSGAWKVADDITDFMVSKKLNVACEVFTYPGHLPDEDNNAQGNGSTGSAESNGNGKQNGSTFHHNGSPTHGYRPSRPMLEILSQRLPWWKRGIDIVLSGTALLVLLPLFGLIALAIKLTSRGPVFFRQTRSGLGGRTFGLYKFRSMVTNAEELRADLIELNEVSGPVFKIKRDPRITSIGHLLRRSSLDELPQLWNVLLGDMSLVGPRPPLPAETHEYDRWHHRRLEVTPGITCIWQVSGRSNVPFIEWMRMDIRYTQRVSLREDLRILLKTAPAVLSGDGAN